MMPTMSETALDRSKPHAGAHLERPDALKRDRFSISDLTSEFDCTAGVLKRAVEIQTACSPESSAQSASEG